jgi:hypothetical protein
MNLVLHLGLHRAASSSLQAWIANARPLLAEASILVLPSAAEPEARPVFAALSGVLLRRAGPAAVANAVAAELDRLQQSWRAVVISDENMLGPFPGGEGPAFAALGDLCTVIGRVASHHEVVPVLVLREHLAWLASLYRVAQFRADVRRFEAFADEVLPGQMPFSNLLTALAAAAGRRPVVAALEAIAEDAGQAFLANLLAELGVDDAGGPLFTHQNPAHRPLAASLRQIAQRRGGFLLLEDDATLQKLLARIEDNPANRTPANLHTAARHIAARTVRISQGLPFQERLARARVRLARQSTGNLLSLPQAEAILRRAIALAQLPLAGEAVRAQLARRFAADRQAVSTAFGLPWPTPHEEVP